MTTINVSPETLESFNDERIRIKKAKKLKKLTGEGFVAYLLQLSRRVTK